MADQTAEPQIQSQTHAEPELTKNAFDPRGVLQKNIKLFVYLGAALFVILAAFASSHTKTTPAQQAAARHEPPQPNLQDNTDNNVQDLKNQLAAERQKQVDQSAAAQAAGIDPALSNATPAQRAAAAGYSPNGQNVPCLPGQTCPQQGYGHQGGGGQSQMTPEQEAAQQLAVKEREKAFESRFSSNLAYSRPADPPPQRAEEERGSAMPTGYALGAQQQESSLLAPRGAGEQRTSQTGQASIKHGPEVNIDSATGQPYVIYEGLTMDTVLMNRLDGDAVGPVKVLVSNAVYSHDHQHVLIPDGTIVLGEAKKIGSSGFGQQRRMSVTFHRMIMPDGYSVDLDQFHGLDQIGEEGLKDKVNNHYLQIFGTSIALGVIAGAGEIAQGGGTISTSGSQAFTTGAAGSVSQSATSVLDRFIQIPPTITIREGHRIKVYFTQDMLLPAYSNHTISQSF
jgi:type IV secretion system protein TrbI